MSCEFERYEIVNYMHVMHICKRKRNRHQQCIVCKKSPFSVTPLKFFIVAADPQIFLSSVNSQHIAEN